MGDGIAQASEQREQRAGRLFQRIEAFALARGQGFGGHIQRRE